jgi:excisionase family DNA binding protein
LKAIINQPGEEAMNTQLDRLNVEKNAQLGRPRFLDVKELAQMLRLKPRTIYEMVSQKRIPYRKAGDRTIFLLDEILQWTQPDDQR